MPQRRAFAMGAILAGAVAACAPSQPGAPNNTAHGAFVGASAGALIRGANTVSTSKTIRGALVGGTLGALAGAILDYQYAVAHAINDPDVSVTKQGQDVVVVFPNSVLFDSSSAKLAPIGQRDVLRLAEHLRKNPDSTVVVIGHTDSSGSLDYNQTLSEHRARAVSTTLVAGGVAPDRITTAGQGATRPLISNDTPAGRAENRRVEVIIRRTK